MTAEKDGRRPSERGVPKPSGSGTPSKPRFFSEIKVGGLPLDELSSATHKAIRRGMQLEAAYWTRHLVVHGFGGYAIRKLAVIAAEDVGLGDPQAVILATSLLDLAFRVTGKTNPRGEDLRAAELQIVGAAIVLACANHSRMLAEICCLAAFHAKHGPRPEIPPEAIDVHTRRGRANGLKRGSPEAVKFWQEHSRIVANEVIFDDDVWKKRLDAAWEIDPSIGFVHAKPDEDGTEGL